jgi:Tfp pilus assembly protein PilO
VNRRTPVIIGVVFLLVAVLAYFFLLSPKIGEVNEARQALETARQEQTVLEADLARLQQLERDAPQVRRQLARLRQQVPPVADLPGIINLLQNAADTSGVDFFSVSPGDPEPDATGMVAVIPAGIQIVGSFFPVDEFLFRLETLRRAAKVITLTVSEGAEGLPQIQANLAVEFYTTDTTAGPGAPLPEPSPTPSPGAPASPGASPAPGESPPVGTTPTPTVSPGA